MRTYIKYYYKRDIELLFKTRVLNSLYILHVYSMRRGNIKKKEKCKCIYCIVHRADVIIGISLNSSNLAYQKISIFFFIIE